MKIDIDNLNRHIAAGTLRKGGWGDGHEKACLMSALVPGAQSAEACKAQGWPLWLAETAISLFDNFDDADYIKRGRALAEAIAASDQDWGRVYRDVRLNAVLPIAARAIGAGDEPWREECRRAVQWSIDNGGAPADADGAAEAAGAAGAVGAAWAAGAAGAAEAEGAVGAVGAARAAGAAARDKICAALMASLKQTELTRRTTE